MILSSPPAAAAGSGATLALAVASVLALLGYLACAFRGEGRGSRPLLLAAWIAQAAAIALDLLGAGGDTPGARFGFGPALSATAWLVLAVYAIETRYVPMPGTPRRLALLAAAAVAVAWAFPGEFKPQAPSPWAPLHWVLGIASYGLVGAAVLHAVLLNRAELQMRERVAGALPATGVPLLRLERLTFLFIGAGFVMLSAALLAGWWFTDTWRWDHKTVFSLLGWVVLAALMFGRRAFGWRGTRATRWLYAGAALLLLAYVGSRFVLEVLLQRAPQTPLG